MTRIIAPQKPQTPARQPFPVVATIAPVAMSLVMWLVTQSVFALMFAALGPAIAVASLADSRIGGRRAARAEAARFAEEVAAAEAEVIEQHARERMALAQAAPSAASLVAGALVRWGLVPPEQLVVQLGLAQQPSAVTLDGATEQRGDDGATVRLRSLRSAATTLLDAPLVTSLGTRVGIAGHGAEPFLRSLVVQLAAALSPADHAVGGDADWLDGLPHRRVPGWRVGPIELLRASSVSSLPADLDTVIRLEAAHAELLRAPGLAAPVSFRPEYLTRAEASSWSAAASAAADRAGLAPAGSGLPPSVAFAALQQRPGPGLACTVGLGPDPVVIDLVADGPHAVVGGTTGSGKSELLNSWLLAMAALHAPEQLNFLLFDFKGGSSFGAVTALQHCVGLVTDLDPAAATRAMRSLSAELRYRERQLAAAGVRDVAQLPTLPRLVVVVDEFAAMAADFAELHALFGDIAARGRSLGVHLVLCTQRPAGVVRDAVLANAGLRISLRVNNRADSSAVIGTDSAAELAGQPPGRAWLSRAGLAAEPVQFAQATDHDVAEVAARWPAAAPRRPWLEPLPTSLDFEPGSFGLIDLPHEQAQRPATWSPATDGNLLVLGASRSGITSALASLAADHPRATVIAADVEQAWDALHSLDADVVIIDDLDALVARFAGEHQAAVLELLAAELRGPRRFVLGAQRLTAPLQSLSALCGSRLLLRMANRQEHVIAGGTSDTYDPDLPPGGGWWKGARVQVAVPPAPLRTAHSDTPQWQPPRLAAAVSTRPRALAARLGECARLVGARDVLAQTGVLVADPDTWQTQWAGFAALRAEHPVLFDACAVSEFRALSRSRRLPPPIADDRTTAWLLDPDGEVRRVRV